MNPLVYDIRLVLTEFPRDWEEQGDTTVLTVPGHEMRVGPSGFSGSTGGGALSVGVSITRDADRIPGCSSTSIAFYRALNRDGSITAQGGNMPLRPAYASRRRPRQPVSDPTGWLRRNVVEGLAWLDEQVELLAPPEPKTIRGVLSAWFWDDDG